jgi:hypothetical protein
LVAYKSSRTRATTNKSIGEVNYIDYKKEYIPFDDMFFSFSNEKAFNTSVKSAIITDVAEQKNNIK